ncbi:MAG: hypothetical protein ACXWQR_19760 [Ktedonobacterales bacterium]
MATGMTTVQDCVLEIIAKGPGYFIRSSMPDGARPVTEWDPATLLEEMRQNSPGVLDDHAWTECSVRPAIGNSCFIHYGVRGSSLGHLEVPGYGHLRALELSQKRQASTDTSAGGARTPLIRLLGY